MVAPRLGFLPALALAGCWLLLAAAGHAARTVPPGAVPGARGPAGAGAGERAGERGGCAADASPAEIARWLVHAVDHGIVSTRSAHLGGEAFGNIKSLSDGACGGDGACESTGRVFFYMSTMDPTTSDLLKDATMAMAISEAQLDAANCGEKDPQNPTCAQLTMSGTITPITEPSTRAYARKALFSRNPAMAHWPKDHSWDLYELHLTDLELVAHYGGPIHPSIDEYYSATPHRPCRSPPTPAARAAEAGGPREGAGGAGRRRERGSALAALAGVKSWLLPSKSEQARW